MYTFEDNVQYLELYSVADSKPVQMRQDRSNVIIIPCLVNYPGSIILNKLESLYFTTTVYRTWRLIAVAGTC